MELERDSVIQQSEQLQLEKDAAVRREAELLGSLGDQDRSWQQQLSSIRRALDDAQNRNSALKKVSAVNGEHKKFILNFICQKENDALRAEIERLRHHQEEVTLLRQEKTDALKERDSLESMFKSSQLEKENALTGVKKDSDEIRVSLGLKDSELAKLREELKARSNELERARTELEDLKSKNQGLTEILSTTQRERDEAFLEREELAEGLRCKHDLLLTTQNDLETSKTEATDLLRERNELYALLLRKEEELFSTREERDRLLNELKEKSSQWDITRNEISSSEQLEAEKRKVAELQKALKEKADGEIRLLKEIESLRRAADAKVGDIQKEFRGKQEAHHTSMRDKEAQLREKESALR